MVAFQLVVLTVVVVVVLCVDGTLWLQSSCTSLSDGLRYIKPRREGEVIPVICSNGYTMIDLSLNFNSVSSYFSSLYKWDSSHGGVYGTDCDDYGSWKSFWNPPSTKYIEWRVAPNCETCIASQTYENNAGYYMTSSYHCNSVSQSTSQCSMDSDSDLSYDAFDLSTSMCNICDDSDELDENGNWKECHSLRLSVDESTESDHNYCLSQNVMVVRPSVVSDRSYCQCYLMDTNHLRTYKVKDTEMSDLPAVSNEYGLRESGIDMDDYIVWEGDDNESDESDANDVALPEEEAKSDPCAVKTYWTNADFTDGTIKITECGEYVLSEDISVNFNAPSESERNQEDWSPNSIDLDDLHWFPTTAQSDSDTGDYVGLDSFLGSYHLGFFAAITIETSRVTIDLNGFELAMDFEYYVQQRFFSLIELGDKPFVGSQGPANFGRDDLSAASDVTIRNGILGRTSHHGIHGNNAVSVTIDNVAIRNFDICGVQCNGCSDLSILNSVIGPSSTDIPVLGRYLHARSFLPRLRYFVDEYGHELVPFYKNGRNVGNYKMMQTVSDLASEMIKQMDLIFFAVTGLQEFTDSDDDWEQWESAKSLFLNENGMNDGGSTYGVLVNGEGTAGTSIGRRQSETNSQNVMIENVEIHGIYSAVREKFWAKNTFDSLSHSTQGLFYDALDWKSIINSDTDEYVGDSYTDLMFASNHVMDGEYCWFNNLYLNTLGTWMQRNEKRTVTMSYSCGSDVQSQVPKGSIGLRSDATQNLVVNGLHIHDIVNRAELGDQEYCGEWETVSFLDESLVDSDIEYGYTGSKAQAMIMDYSSAYLSNIVIENVESSYGHAIGISIYKESTIYECKAVTVNSVTAGKDIKQSELENIKLPNQVPSACSVFVGNGRVTFDGDMSQDIYGYNIAGYDFCVNGRGVGNMQQIDLNENPLIAFGNKENEENVGLKIKSKMNYTQIVIVAALFVVSITLISYFYICHRKKSDYYDLS